MYLQRVPQISPGSRAATNSLKQKQVRREPETCPHSDHIVAIRRIPAAFPAALASGADDNTLRLLSSSLP